MNPLWILTLWACAPSIEDVRLHAASDPPGDAPPVESPTLDGSPADGVDADTGEDADTGLTVRPPPWRPTLDATSADTWVHVDLDSLALTDADGPWSLRLQRFRVAIDGGVSGDGDVEVVWAEPADSSPFAVPTDGWTVDLADADEDGEPEYAFADWYAYDSATHVLTPRDRRWWVRTAGGGIVSLVFRGYYDSAGTSGFVSFDAVVVESGGAP